MGKFSDYTPAAAADYLDATTFLIQDPDGNTLLANLADLKEYFFCDVKCASLSVLAADVLQLNTTPQEVIAAPGAGKAIEVIAASGALVYGSVAYATNTNLQLITAGATDPQYESGKLLLSTVDTHSKLGENLVSGATDTQIIENAALNLTVETGDPTAGDSDIEVFVFYREIDV